MIYLLIYVIIKRYNDERGRHWFEIGLISLSGMIMNSRTHLHLYCWFISPIASLMSTIYDYMREFLVYIYIDDDIMTYYIVLYKEYSVEWNGQKRQVHKWGWRFRQEKVVCFDLFFSVFSSPVAIYSFFENFISAFRDLFDFSNFWPHKY